MGRDFMSRTKLSLLFRGENFYEASFAKKQTLKIYKISNNNNLCRISPNVDLWREERMV